MSKYHVIILLIASICSGTYAQIVIPNGGTLQGGDGVILTTNSSMANAGTFSIGGSSSSLVLTGSNDIGISSTQEILIPNLGIFGGGNKFFEGKYLITEDIVFQNGHVVVGNREDQDLFVLGPNIRNDIGSPDSYVIGTLVRVGEGDKFFPTGTPSRFAPAQLLSVSGSGNGEVITALRAFANDGSYVPLEVPSDVDSVSRNWLWGFFSENFSNAKVQLPVLNEDAPIISGDNKQGVIIKVDTVTLIGESLGGTLESGNSIISQLNLTGNVSALMIGSSLVIIPIVHNIITPNGDSKNDYLIIDNIEVYADDNEVIILDRWGTEVYRKRDFTNFDDFTNPNDGSFDFLEPGNYICILKYAGRTIKQTITVLK